MLILDRYYGGGCKPSKYNIEKEYIKKYLIGKGGYGKVYLVVNRLGQYFALKEITENNKYAILIQDEIAFMKLLDNPFILRFYEELPPKTRHPNMSDLPNDSPMLEKIKNTKGTNAQSRQIERVLRTIPDKTEFRLIIEYCEGGDLLEYVNKNYIPDDSLIVILYQIFNGVKYLHEKGIIHRDLKLENILLKFHDNISCLKIADFGLAKYFNVKNCCSDYGGTSNYIAPEVFSANDDSSDSKHKYTEKCDMWSIGVILFKICLRDMPFDNKQLKIERSKNRNLDDYLEIHFSLDKHQKILKNIPSRILQLIKGLLTINPRDRWSCEECLASKLFRNYDTSVNQRCIEVYDEDSEMDKDDKVCEE